MKEWVAIQVDPAHVIAVLLERVPAIANNSFHFKIMSFNCIY